MSRDCLHFFANTQAQYVVVYSDEKGFVKTARAGRTGMGAVKTMTCF